MSDPILSVLGDDWESPLAAGRRLFDALAKAGHRVRVLEIQAFSGASGLFSVVTRRGYYDLDYVVTETTPEFFGVRFKTRDEAVREAAHGLGKAMPRKAPKHLRRLSFVTGADLALTGGDLGSRLDLRAAGRGSFALFGLIEQFFPDLRASAPNLPIGAKVRMACRGELSAHERLELRAAQRALTFDAKWLQEALLATTLSELWLQKTPDALLVVATGHKTELLGRVDLAESVATDPVLQ